MFYKPMCFDHTIMMTQLLSSHFSSHLISTLDDAVRGSFGPLQNQTGVVAQAVGEERDRQAIEPNLARVSPEHAVQLQALDWDIRINHAGSELPRVRSNVKGNVVSPLDRSVLEDNVNVDGVSAIGHSAHLVSPAPSRDHHGLGLLLLEPDLLVGRVGPPGQPKECASHHQIKAYKRETKAVSAGLALNVIPDEREREREREREKGSGGV